MAIKVRKKSDSEDAVQSKVKGTTGNQIIVIDDSDDGSYCDLQSKVKVKKKKQLVKGTGSDRKGAKKKKKKKKVDSELKYKVCVNLPIITECNSDSKLLKETEKISGTLKKKGDRRLSHEREGYYEEDPSEEVSKEQQGGHFLTGKARKRNIPDSHGGDDEFTAKKKRKREKKRKHNPACSSGLHCGDIEDESKKQIPQEMLFSNRKKALTQNAQGDSAVMKKKKVACCLTSMGDQKRSNGISDNGIVADCQLQGGQSCKGRAFGCKQLQEDVVYISEEESKLTKKKKKKNRLKKEKVAFLCSSANNQGNQADVSDENLKKAKSKKKPVVGNGKTGLIPDSKGASKVTKKKKIQVEVVRGHPALLVDDKDGSTNERKSAEKRRKKETKKPKGAQNGTARSDDGRFENGSKRHVKKRKDRDHEGVRDILEEPTLKKARIKAEAKGKEDEIKVVAFKKGNCDEINIDKMRRQALQEEIDRESGKTQAIKEEGDLDGHFGQWSTATFESSERKTKFLRLLGGFKKGSASAPDFLAPAPKLNMALGKSREQNLQRNLQAEFEKAVEWKHRRGLGLGFQPAPQKRVHIDKYASKSIKFEV
ncbi:lysine-rich nucleolar protein 1 [Elgaria multicarinata webbii]|uniref:lysine-rich nucleolar protein 1 n=1 Tax=Elgaria multicarinata webbii TaxID=159646 RepID=UPI002FCD09BF